MSAGICIMNKNAIAMAADSAVTVGDHIAIHNSANKLFSLSKVAPVGVIIYANGSLMNVPFEIIIKEYKKHIGQTTFATLKEYVDDFIDYLESEKKLFKFDINEEAFIKTVFLEFAAGLQGDYSIAYEQQKNDLGRDLSDLEERSVVQETVASNIQFINEQERIEGFEVTEYIKNNYKNTFCDYFKTESEFKWLSDDQAELLAEHVCELYGTKFERNNYVGLAIAGYGEEEIYPSLYHLHISGFINGKLRYIVVQEALISDSVNVSVVPLAQVDVMQTFLFGINDEFLGYLAAEIPSQISEIVNDMDDNVFASGKKKDVISQLSGVTDTIIRHIQKAAVDNYMAPIFDSVATLPIEELGLLAESMINITSIRRKVAFDNNIGTVGGPIDVSIISKGDGFIWLKRKHYFEQKYNPQFFYTHYNGIKGGDPDEE